MNCVDKIEENQVVHSFSISTNETELNQKEVNLKFVDIFYYNTIRARTHVNASMLLSTLNARPSTVSVCAVCDHFK